jgi:hypothetical protein
MTVSNIHPSQSISNSSGSGEEMPHLLLKTRELSKEVFFEQFRGRVCISTNEFVHSGADKGEVLSFNSIAIGDCITMFGIGRDRSLFAWHSSTVEEGPERRQTDEEIVLEKLENYFKGYGEDVRRTQFDIYLIGGNGSKISSDLYNGMVFAIPKFFNEAVIVAEFMNSSEKKLITANFNTNGELHYYIHNAQPHEDFFSNSGEGF